MSVSVRRVLIQRLEELGEFKERLHDSSMTQYKRKQALKENMPADFVEERKEEIESRWFTHVLMLVGILSFPLIILGDYLWLSPETVSFGVKIGIAAFTVVVFVIASAYRIRGLANYYPVERSTPYSASSTRRVKTLHLPNIPTPGSPLRTVSPPLLPQLDNSHLPVPHS